MSSRYLSTDSLASRTSFDQPIGEDNLSNHGDIAKENAYKLTEDEKMEIGGVSAHIYWGYLKHVGLCVFLSALLGYISFVSFETAGNVWLSKWSSEGIQNQTEDSVSTTLGLSVYGAMGLAQGICVLAGGAILVFGSIKASRSYHDKILNSVLRSPMSFFDRTPMGRIMNRFSTDMDIMDIQIYPVIDGWLHCLLYSLASFIVIGMNTPIFLVILLPIGIAYFIIQIEPKSEFSDLSDDDNAAKKTYESRILEGESSSDEGGEEKYGTVANSSFLCKQDAISNKTPQKIKMDRLKFKLEKVEALAVSPPTNKSILTNDEDNSVVIPFVKRSKCYNPPVRHVMAFILAIPG
ncbi:multidrug resistance-associated protein 1 [Trichonephila clavipes]|nr:multidrug resistance-associated protein 1 [Trichonephila clavipes]